MNNVFGKPQNRIRPICFTAVFFLVAVLLIFSPIIFGAIVSEKVLPNELYTFEQTYTEPDGTVAEVYASGDSDFRYYHDGDGYILTADDEGYLRYAKNDGGHVRASGVRWNASSLQKSFIDKMTSEDVVRGENPQLETSHGYDGERPQVLADSRVNTVYNVVIFVAFADSKLTEADIPLKIRETFSNDSGTYNSLKNYFAAQTAGEKELVNLFAYESGAVFVYVSPNSRIYYSFTLTEDTRIKRERELIASAAAAFDAADKDDVLPENLDSDGDGYADAVSFVLLDKPVSTQGSILWPHKWHTASIGAKAEICGVPIGVYSLNFTASHFVTFAHETGHVLGAPDYYASTNNSMPLVAEWDVMSITQKSGSPANMLAYTRKKYLGMEAGVIETVRAGQTVTRKNAADVRADDVLAVRIPTDAEGVYIYAEYRAKAEADEFDGGQKSSGLVVYRVNENVGGYGNINARTVADYSNLEVFVYRKGGANNLNAVYAAALNAKDKTDFNAIGSGTDTPLTVNAKTVLDACFSDVLENGDGTVSFTVYGDGIKSDYDGQFTVKGATASDWTYFAKPGERFTVDIGKALPTSRGVVRAFYDYDDNSLTEISSSGLSKTFEVKQEAAAVESLTVRIRDEISSCQLKFAVVTDGREALKAEIKGGTAAVFLGDGWETVTAVGGFGGEERALKDIVPLAFNPWSGTGTRRVHFVYGTELYYCDLTVEDRPVYMETEVEEISLLVGETLPDGVSATVHFASGEARSVSITDCGAEGFDSSEPGTVTVTLKYGADLIGAEVFAELKVSVARPVGAEIVGTTTELNGRTYPTAELISSDDGVTVNFGKTAVEYYLDYGTETVPVTASYGGSFSNDWITVDFVGGSPEDSGIFVADVKVYRRANGRETVVLALENVEFRILKSINKASIVINENLKDEAGTYVVYLEDREDWEIFCEVEYFDGTSETVALTVTDEDILLDEPYGFAPEYLGHRTEGVTLLIRNTAVGIESGVSVNYWGEPLELSPVAVMADGTKRLLSDGDWKYAEGCRFDERGAIGVAQHLQVELTSGSGLVKEGGSVTSRITVTPVDGLKRIELIDYKKEYEYGDGNFVVRYLRTVYYSGRTEITAPPSDKISVTGFDTTVMSGAEYSRFQTVTVGYSDKTADAEIEIINPVISVRLVGLQFDGEANAYLKDVTSDSPFNLGLVYKNEATETVTIDVGAPANYAAGVPGKHSAVFNIAKENRIICTATVAVMNYVPNVRQADIVDNTTGDAPDVIALRFGEALNIGRFSVRYTAGSVEDTLTLGKAVADTATKNYSLKREEGGSSTVTVRVPALRDASGKAVSFTVRINVAPRVNERMLAAVSAASGVGIKHDGKIIVLEQQTTVAELTGLLKSDYLDISYKGGTADELAGGYSVAGINRVFDTVELRNAEGTLVASYKVCLVGDANGDGRVSSEDVPAFAKRILENSTEIYDHEAAGGSLNLQSFVKMIRTQKEREKAI